MRGTVITVVALWTAVAAQPGGGGQAAAVVAQSQPLGSGVTAVLVDVVVRDSKGNPVTNLQKEDFEVLEDGVRQEIGEIVAIDRAPTASPRGAARSAGNPPPPAVASSPAADPNTHADAAPSPTFLALVFDRLTPEARALA